MSATLFHQKRAFTLVDVLLMVATLCILVIVFLPQLARTSRGGCRISCANNLKQIGLSFRTWALDNNDKFPMQVAVTNGGTKELVESGTVYVHFQVMSNELSTPKVLFCPQETDSKRIAASTFCQTVPSASLNTVPFTNDNNVSYFVEVDAQDTYPQMVLIGDKNIAIDGRPAQPGLNAISTNRVVAWRKPQHNGSGYVGLADGSVQQPSGTRLTSLLRATGVSTNRIAFP